MVDWFPIVFIAFKVLVLGIGMFYAVKWHYQKGKKDRGKRVSLGMFAKAAGIFILLLLTLLLLTFFVSRQLGLDLTL